MPRSIKKNCYKVVKTPRIYRTPEGKTYGAIEIEIVFPLPKNVTKGKK